MDTSDLGRYALTIAVTTTVLAGCGTSQSTFAPSINTQGVRTAHYVKASSSVYQSLFSFDGKNGAEPVAGLTALNGKLYGTTQSGGATKHCHWCGTVFSITTKGQEVVLHSFSGNLDGADPVANLIAVNGALYGTTLVGGGGKCRLDVGKGCGTIYSISPSGLGYNVLHAFTGKKDGAFPRAGLTFFRGMLYGTAMSGGEHGVGVAFSITPGGTFTVLHSFAGTPDGRVPTADLTFRRGQLYGTTALGGSYGTGTAYSLTTSGKEHVLFSFRCSYCMGGSYPSALTWLNGVFYGTTQPEANYHYGMVFSLNMSGNEKVLYTFQGSDGAYPTGLTAWRGTLYGTTVSGGGSACGKGCGTVFTVATSGAESILYGFQGMPDGATPGAPPVTLNRMLYGTTQYGGAKNKGTVFSIAP